MGHMKKSIKRAVWIRIIATICAVLVFSGVATLCTLRIQRANRDIEQANRLMSQAFTAEVAHYKWSSGLSGAVYAGAEFTGSTSDTGCTLGQWLYGDRGTDDAQVTALLDQIQPLHKTIHASAAEALALLNGNGRDAQTYYQDTVQPNIVTLVGLLDQVVSRSEALSTAADREMESAITLMLALCAVCLAVVLACLYSLVRYVIRRIVEPILEITQASRGLAQGSLTFRPAYSSQDEVGELIRSLEQSVESIAGYVREIDRIMDELSQGNIDVGTTVPFVGDFQSIERSINSFTGAFSDTILRIGQAADQVSAGSEQIANSSQALAQGATEQASAVEELSATINEISGSARKNAQTAAAAREDAHLAGGQVEQSNEHMAKMIQAMQSISESSQKISKIIATIENIAFQTNLLALNAAVEAARAGQAGKGFAVVADEVRNLAAKSDEAAKATKELIQSSVQNVQAGSRIVEEVSESLEKTTQLAARSVAEIERIAQAVGEEAASIAQITEGIEQISAVVQTNSATSQESAAASEELSSQAQMLKAQVRRFRTKETPAEPRQLAAGRF
ncbi:hypothetical protein CE91St41_33620 [Oscillospiraceae bacterium]|nr:hypothetical protein CE91St40_33610 [Oscillospiraceae bacterium]BDF76473.1 hypothetical protein CE91St41_33620 [Oscillospiraceae bacterium]